MFLMFLLQLIQLLTKLILFMCLFNQILFQLCDILHKFQISSIELVLHTLHFDFSHFYFHFFNTVHPPFYLNPLQIYIISNTMIKSFLRITRNYTQHRYHKFKVTRLPGQEVVFMLKDVTTVGDLYQHIQHHFPQPNTQLFAGSDFTSKIGEITVTEEMKKDSQQVTNTPFLPIFLSNDLYIYQTHQNKAHVLYGIECLQLNFTNNRNLPQTIQNGIINLDQEWQTTKTISQALQMPKRADPAVLQQEKQQLSRVLGKTIANIQTMTQVKLHNPVNNFINRMSLLMGTNWVFLYILTFGYYGWDVGEPISYLTSIAVELMAMLRWYDLEQRLNNQFQTNQGRYIGMMNLLAQKRTQRWMHCYLRRQLN